MSLGWLVSGAYHPAYRKKFNILAAQISGTPSDFPVALVIASDADLASRARADAHDIAITKGDGVTELAYERVAWDEATGALEIWFKAPDPQSGDEYYFYYGDADQGVDRQNATGVWSNSYVAVWHMNQDPSGDAPQILDSTSNNNDLTSAGGMLPEDLVGAQIGKGIDFDGLDDGLEDTLSGMGYQDLTLEAWVNSVGFYFIRTDYTAGTDRLGIEIVSDFFYFYCYDGVNNPSWLDDVDVASAWHYAALARDDSGNRLYAYRDGAEVNNWVDTTTFNGQPLANCGVGTRPGGGDRTTGIIDEVRVSTTVRSADWIGACFNNQDSPAPGGTFWSALGDEEKEPRYPAAVFQIPAIV